MSLRLIVSGGDLPPGSNKKYNDAELRSPLAGLKVMLQCVSRLARLRLNSCESRYKESTEDLALEGSAQLVCRQCDWQSVCGPAQMLGWLRDVKMARRDAIPDPELLGELFRSAVPRFACPRCGVVGLSLGTVDTAEEEDDDEAWGMARKCEGCDALIAAERLEVFPDTRLCVACQAKSDRGEATGPEEYCPHCGSVMTLSQSRRGLTRYVMKCPSCRK